MQTIKKLKQITNDYDKLKIYQKAYEHLKNINAGFRNILCSNQSEIYKLSGDDKLSYLVEHLIEYRTQQYSIGSIIKNNIKLWEQIHEMVIDKLINVFKINNIEKLFITSDWNVDIRRTKIYKYRMCGRII